MSKDCAFMHVFFRGALLTDSKCRYCSLEIEPANVN